MHIRKMYTVSCIVGILKILSGEKILVQGCKSFRGKVTRSCFDVCGLTENPLLIKMFLETYNHEVSKKIMKVCDGHQGGKKVTREKTFCPGNSY